MVAFNENDVDVRNILPPLQEKFQFLIGLTVKKVANDEQLNRFVKLNGGKQALQVFFKNILRNGNAGFAEMAGFAKVQVGNNQCFFFFPVDAPLRRKPEGVLSNPLKQIHRPKDKCSHPLHEMNIFLKIKLLKM